MFWGIRKGVKIRQSDTLFSKIVRKERNYICEKCGRREEPNSYNLGLSHFWPRRNETVRYDRRNVDVMHNIPCHDYFENHRKEYETWKEKRMGTKAYNILMIIAHQSGKWDKFIEKELCKQFRKEL